MMDVDLTILILIIISQYNIYQTIMLYILN